MKRVVFKAGDNEVVSLTEDEILSLGASFGEITAATATLFDREITSIKIEESEEE